MKLLTKFFRRPMEQAYAADLEAAIAAALKAHASLGSTVSRDQNLSSADVARIKEGVGSAASATAAPPRP